MSNTNASSRPSQAAATAPIASVTGFVPATAACGEPPSPSVDHDAHSLSHDQLHQRIIHLMQRERDCTVAIIDHLAEMDRRKLYRDRGHSSLFNYVTNELHYSTAAAYRRIKAARFVCWYRPLRGMIVRREVTLGAIAAVANLITPQNAGTVLPRLRGATIKDAQLMRSQLQGGEVPRERVTPIVVRRQVASGLGLSEGSSGPPAREPTALLQASPSGAPISSGDHFRIESKTAQPVANKPLQKRFRLEFSIDEATMAQLEKATALLSNRISGRITNERVFQLLLGEFLKRNDPAARHERRLKRRQKVGLND